MLIRKPIQRSAVGRWILALAVNLTPTQKMNRKNLLTCVTCVVLPLTLLSRLPAQEKSAPANPRPASAEEAKTKPVNFTASKPLGSDEVLALDPFVVSADEDEGYAARYTLAGTRIRTDVRDVGSSITTLTTKFLKDTNSTNIVDVLVYTPNAEVAGPGGNFLGNGDDESAGALLYGRTRIRGLVPADNTRDLFLTSIPFDSYNSGGIDIQRGANSILFGIGSPGGIVNTRINHANFRNSRSVEAQVETFGSTRFTGDFNQVLIDKELSFRLSILDKARKFQQKPAFEDDKRIYAAMRWDPSFLNKHGMHTTFEASYEDGKIDSNQPRNAPPGDFLTPFYDSSFNGIRSAGLNYRTGVTYSTTNKYVNTGELMGSQTNISAFTQGQAETTAYRANVSGNIPWVGEGFWQGMNGYAKYAKNLKLPGWTVNAFKDKAITDDSIFDYYNKLLDGDTKAEFNYFKVFNAALRQTFLDDSLGYELVYDHQQTHSGGRRFLSTKGYGLFMDVMGFLPGGIKGGSTNPAGGTFAEIPDPVNPHYGQVMVIGGYNQGSGSDWTDDTKDTGRFTAFYELNFKKLMGEDSFAGRVFGRNTFSVLGSKYQQDVTNATSKDFYTSDSFQGNFISSSARPVAIFDYLSSTKYTAINSVVGANLPGLRNLPVPATSQPIALFNTIGGARTYNTYNYDTVVNSLIDEEQRIYSGGGKRRANIDSWAAVWQGYWFNGTVIPLVGYRKDTAYNTNANGIPSQTTRNLTVANPYSDTWVLGTAGAKQKVESFTYSVVTHLPEKWRAKLPGHMDVQLIANSSENFDPRPGRTDVIGRALPAPDGNTKEFGLGISLLDDKLYLKVVHYKTIVKNADISSLFNISALRALEQWATQSAASHLGLNGPPAVTGAPGVINTIYGFSGGNPVTYRPPGPFVGSPYTGQVGDPFPSGTLRAPYTQAELDTAYATQIAASTAYRANFPSDAFLTANGVNIPAFKSGTTTNVPSNGTLPSATVTGTTASEGTELELVATPIKGLNVSFNVSKTKATRYDMAQSYKEYVEQRFAVFQGPAGDVRLWTGGDNDTGIDPYHTNGGGGLARTYFYSDVLAPVRKFAALAGTNVPELRPWSANVTANYAFQNDSAFKGFNVGGAYRWQDKDIIGYPVIVDSAGLEQDDVAHPYHGDSEGALDLWLGYYRQNIWHNVDLRLRFGVRNVLYKKELIVASVQPDGSPGAYRIPSPRVFNFSAAFEF
jgi:outer membrane receptor protein involved in Fe transport